MANIDIYLANILNAVLGEEVRGSIHDAIEAINDSVEEGIDEAAAMVGTPKTAATVSAMTDTEKIYVYTGSETGYTAGHWYYHNGTAWVSGGVYGGTIDVTDDGQGHITIIVGGDSNGGS